MQTRMRSNYPYDVLCIYITNIYWTVLSTSSSPDRRLIDIIIIMGNLQKLPALAVLDSNTILQFYLTVIY